eukprot:7388684-Prymnesium_polylepis.1
MQGGLGKHWGGRGGWGGGARVGMPVALSTRQEGKAKRNVRSRGAQHPGVHRPRIPYSSNL